ncbi:unnamed protein product [Adineta steineri]|uniref:DUF7107 domain-containing protein n=1 Tax=Adineta steineri TaxID=433720 RepID=A0A814GHJ7_9BILA|nr:unnamed protein product [Adineta steineri]CAF0843635.1 unnamed protein product [Adineta steineri]CAF0996498.1 unnamed protein product [Adineta steineri]CAF3802696.1 unnamed protein product [Adineta steineri]CAF3839327.1 unnamed protein product [Adineta steineri]
MKPPIFLLIVIPRYVFAIVNVIIDVRSTCESTVDCLSYNDANTVCYRGHCVPCRNSSESCSNSAHCCSGSRCYRHQCTPLYKTGQTCHLHRECFNTDDFCINQICTRCTPLYSSCSTDPSSTPCCIGNGICRYGICQPTQTYSKSCLNTFDCSDELVCLSGICQDPLEGC